jgi:hypothetical protein
VFDTGSDIVGAYFLLMEYEAYTVTTNIYAYTAKIVRGGQAEHRGRGGWGRDRE